MIVKRWRIEPHSSVDKHFVIRGPLNLEIDFDDVNHGEVDQFAKYVEVILNKHFPPRILMRRCDNEDCDNYGRPWGSDGPYQCPRCNFTAAEYTTEST